MEIPRSARLGWADEEHICFSSVWPFQLKFLTVTPSLQDNWCVKVFVGGIAGLLLQSFKQRLTDPSGVLSNWNASDETPCNWKGVVCRNSTNAVAFMFATEASTILLLETKLFRLAISISTFLLSMLTLRNIDVFVVKLQRSPVRESHGDHFFSVSRFEAAKTLVRNPSLIPYYEPMWPTLIILPKPISNVCPLNSNDFCRSLLNNQFRGKIPESFSNLTSLEVL